MRPHTGPLNTHIHPQRGVDRIIPIEQLHRGVLQADAAGLTRNTPISTAAGFIWNISKNQLLLEK
jgi:hypothetical protein